MKRQTSIILAALAAAVLPAAAQGRLTPPPGVPAPVMKTLDQIEARIPLVEGQPGVSINGVGGAITITQPGSYYLAKNHTVNTSGADGITISAAAAPLTLDLNGYSLICTSIPGGNAIASSSSAFITIRNGHIQGGTTVSGSTFTLNGWQAGVILSGPALVDDIHVRGVRGRGIDARASDTDGISDASAMIPHS